MIRYIAAILLLSILSCRVAQTVTDPAVRLYKRGSCISIDVPPITLTPSQTAAERQLIGKDTLIEEDGWLIATAKGNAEESEEKMHARQLLREKGVLEFYQKDIERLRLEGILGESHTGEIRTVPSSVSGKRIDPAKEKNIRLIADQINQSRSWIYRYYSDLEMKKASPDQSRIRKLYLLSHYEKALPGEFIFTENSRWEQKN